MIDWLAGIAELTKEHLLGDKHRVSFIFGLLANLLWIAHVCIDRESPGLLLVVIPAAFYNIRNWSRWKAD